MRVAHIISGLDAIGGGGTEAVLSLARWQQCLGHQCTIITTLEADTELRKCIATDVGAHVIAFKRFGPLLIRYAPEFGLYLSRHGREHDVYIMHSSYQFPVFRAAQYCRKHSIPYIFMPHGSLDPSVRRKHPLRNRLIDAAYHDVVLRGAAAWHFTSDGEKDKCERKIWKSCFVEPLGIDIKNFHIDTRTNAFRKRYSIPDDAKLFLFLSRITLKKGVQSLLQSFLRVAASQPKLYLALCGPVDPDQRPLLEAAQRHESAGARIVTTGFITGEAKRAAFLDSDIFVLPTYGENFGFAVFEALAYGLPVLTTTGLDVHAKLAELGRVRIIEPTAEALYAAMSDIARNGWAPTTDIHTARQWLDDNFSWRASAQRILAQYEKVLCHVENANTAC